MMFSFITGVDENICNGVEPLIRLIVTRGRAVTALLCLGLLSQVETVLFTR